MVSAPCRRRPTLLVVIGQLGIGGTECHLAQILPLIQELNFNVMVFALKDGGANADVLRNAGIRIVSPQRRRTGILGLLQAGAMFNALVRRERPDIVHFFLPAAYIVGALSILGCDCKRVMSRRSLATYQAQYPGVRQLERWLHRRMDVVLANSNAVARELYLEGVSQDRLGVIHNGVIMRPLMQRALSRASLGLPHGALIFVCVANLIPYKGHRDLITAFGLARDQLPENWILLLVGRDDGMGEMLRQYAEQLDLKEHLHWAGAVVNVGDYLHAADIGLLASHEEGFSNAVLEGMMAGLPMIVTDVGGNPEAVIDGECGLVVPAHAPSALGDAIAELARSEVRRHAWGEAGRRRAESQFSVDRCVSLYRALYENLASDVRPPVPAAAMVRDEDINLCHRSR